MTRGIDPDKVFIGSPCIWGHRRRYKTSGRCVECGRTYSRRYAKTGARRKQEQLTSAISDVERAELSQIKAINHTDIVAAHGPTLERMLTRAFSEMGYYTERGK